MAPCVWERGCPGMGLRGAGARVGDRNPVGLRGEPPPWEPLGFLRGALSPAVGGVSLGSSMDAQGVCTGRGLGVLQVTTGVVGEPAAHSPCQLAAAEWEKLKFHVIMSSCGIQVVISLLVFFSTEASKQAPLMEVLKKEVRAMLIAAKAGLTPEQLEEQYMAMVCKPLPLHDLGFQSTLELVTQMPEVVRICSSKTGTVILKGEGLFSKWVEELFGASYWSEAMFRCAELYVTHLLIYFSYDSG